jgi:hypothetical protein
MRSRILFLFFIFLSFCSFGETFFICTDEQCNGEIVPLDEQVREGVFDGLFEAGHIVFDDCVTKRDRAITNEASIRELLVLASEEGAPFLVIVRVQSAKKVLSAGVERIESEAEYLLYDVAAGACIGRDTLTANNFNKESELKRNKLWFAFGQEISKKIEKVFTTYQVTGKKEISRESSKINVKEPSGNGK